MFGSISIDDSSLRRGVTYSRLSQLTSFTCIYRASNFVLPKHKAILLINSKVSSHIISFWQVLLVISLAVIYYRCWSIELNMNDACTEIM